MSFRERITGYLRDAALPALVGAAAAAAAIGLIDGALNTYSLVQTLATAGFVSMIAVPAGFGIGLVVHWLWKGWGMAELATTHTERTGGAPRLAAWVLALIAGLWLIAATSLTIAESLIEKYDDNEVIAALYASLIVAGGLIIAAATPAAASGLTRGVRWVDQRVHRRLGRSLITPRWIATLAGVAIAALVVSTWKLSIEPRIGFLDVTPLVYLSGWFGAILLAQALWPLLQGHLIAMIVTATLVLGLGATSLGTAYYVRHHKPYAMLEVWGNTTWGGAAIDFVYNIQTLRRSLNLKGIRPKARPGAVHPNVVLITVDTLRADRTPPYGGTAKMPGLGQLGRDGAVFEWAFSPGNVTRRSLPTLITGLSPHRVRGRVAGWALRMDPRHITLAERFRAAGYDTAGFLAPGSQFHPDHRLGLIRGIDDLFHTNLLSTDEQGDLGARARDWLRQRGDRRKPFFLWIHFIDPHLWDVTYKSNKHGRDMRVRYDLALADVDRSLRKLLSVLWTPELRKRTIVAVTADHGEGLGDRGQRFHSTNLYNSQIHVPLIVAGAGIAPSRIRQSVGLVDVAPTLLDLAGFYPPELPHMDGASLAAVIRGTQQPGDGEAYSAMVRDRSVKHGQRALVSGRYKLIDFDTKKSPELYDLHTDPNERKNLALRRRDLVKKLQQRLEERRRIDSISPF